MIIMFLNYSKKTGWQITCNSYSSLEYFPYSTIPPKIRILVPSTTKPYAAHPGGMSPFTGGTNHWFVAINFKKM